MQLFYGSELQWKTSANFDFIYSTQVSSRLFFVPEQSMTVFLPKSVCYSLFVIYTCFCVLHLSFLSPCFGLSFFLLKLETSRSSL